MQTGGRGGRRAADAGPGPGWTRRAVTGRGCGRPVTAARGSACTPACCRSRPTTTSPNTTRRRYRRIVCNQTTLLLLLHYTHWTLIQLCGPSTLPAVVPAPGEPEVVPTVLAARRGAVGQPDHAARLLAHLYLGRAATATATAAHGPTATARFLYQENMMLDEAQTKSKYWELQECARIKYY